MTHEGSSGRQQGALNISNRLPSDHPARRGLDAALQKALASLPGPWDVTVEAASGNWTVSVVGPDGSRWTLTCADRGLQNVEFISEQVGAACRRRLARAGPAGARPDKKPAPSAPATASANARPPAKGAQLPPRSRG